MSFQLVVNVLKYSEETTLVMVMSEAVFVLDL